MPRYVAFEIPPMCFLEFSAQILGCQCLLFITQIFCDITPKREALAEANAELEVATNKLLSVKKKLDVSATQLLFLY